MQQRICPNCGAAWYSSAAEQVWTCETCGAEVGPECAVRGDGTGKELEARVRELEEENLKLREVSHMTQEVDRLRVQLAGCSAAAMGVKDDLQPGDYGWSAAYDDVVALRKRMEELEAETRRLRAVAEAARSYLKNCVGNECDDEGMYDLCEVTCPLEDLREALAALKEAKD